MRGWTVMIDGKIEDQGLTLDAARLLVERLRAEGYAAMMYPDAAVQR